ncbi:MAG: DUF2804 domain-containing protein [Bacilli bacterium]
MRKQNELSAGALLSDSQNLVEAGYSNQLIKEYDKSKIKSLKSRLKEWDYYYFGNDKSGVGLVIGDNSYVGQLGFVIFNFSNKKLCDSSKLIPFPHGKMGLPKDSSTSYKYELNGNFIEIEIVSPKVRKIKAFCKNAHKDLDLSIDVTLTATCDDSMVIATPFAKDKHFYYNQKINNFVVTGKVILGSINLNTMNDYMGVLDWGRGIRTYINTWNWLSISSKQNDDYFGLNLGYGFGNTLFANENVMFLNDKSYRLCDVIFEYEKSFTNHIKLNQTCYIRSRGNDEIHLEFTPVFLRFVNINILLVHQRTNQIFGTFTGYITYGEDKKRYNVKNAFGFFENVYNRW